MANETENNTPRKISRSEKTNAKNLENLHIANVTIDTLENYNPSNPLIKKTALADFETGFAARMRSTNEAVAAEDTAIEGQTVAFKLVPQKITRVIGAIKGQGVSGETLEHLMTTVRRLRGVRVNNKTPDDLPVNGNGSKHSVSQQSIAGILEGLDLLGEQINGIETYRPNEEEFKKESLTTWISGLRDARHARLNAQAVTTGARQVRDAYGYGPEGLIVRMKALKAYLETILDKSDDRYKKIKGLKFVDNG
jgi:hypothetical protein